MTNAVRQRLPTLLRCARFFTQRIPPVPHASGIANRIVKPALCRFSRWGQVYCDVWDVNDHRIGMYVDPCDCVGGNLFFVPQLYERWERHWLAETLPRGGIFVDVGANIGAYSLWAAGCVGDSGRVLAFEAGSDNFALFCRNVAVNGFNSVIKAVRLGISDREEVLNLSLAPQGSQGTNSFSVAHGGAVEEVPCRSLYQVLVAEGVPHVDVLKLDIEGFEYRVLSRFFADLAVDPALTPDHILVEILGGPATQEQKQALRHLILDNGYVLIKERENSWFRRRVG